MKKLLWVCNLMLPAIARELHLPYSSREGWLSGIFERIQGEESVYRLGVCFPVRRELLAELQKGDFLGEQVRRFTAGNMVCYAFEERMESPELYEPELEGRMEEILADFQPDLLHIFGTEFPHTLAAVRAFGKPRQTLIGIQGLCSEIAKVYMAGLPEEVQKAVTFRDWLRKDSIRQQQEKFAARGNHERQALLECGHITGRTDFDRRACEQINPHARYHFMNETMRREFYQGSWKREACIPHSLFLGQGDYPLKGMHFVLEALARLTEKYPDSKLYVAGNSVIAQDTWKEKLKLPAYGKYLLRLIARYGLQDRVIMTGPLDAAGMRERILSSGVFVCASVLENSPNTVGEAMLLGVPVAASAVGGIPDLITEGEDGLLFPAGDTAALAEAVERLWTEPELAERISENARRKAAGIHDGEANYRRLLAIYQQMEKEIV